ncbi:GlcG/HbpS family heme-binding protein [Nocardia thailandica]
MTITSTHARTVLAAALRIAQTREHPVSAAVVDTGGNLVAFARMDRATLVTIDTAVGKAFTAVSIGADTVALTEAIQPGAPLFGTGLALAGSRSFVPYGGGVLLRDGDDIIGALGISGAPTSLEDHHIGVEAARS